MNFYTVEWIKEIFKSYQEFDFMYLVDLLRKEFSYWFKENLLFKDFSEKNYFILASG